MDIKKMEQLAMGMSAAHFALLFTSGKDSPEFAEAIEDIQPINVEGEPMMLIMQAILLSATATATAATGEVKSLEQVADAMVEIAEIMKGDA